MPDNRPLSDVRILDFSWAIVGNVAAKALGDFGAEIWKIESSTRLSGERLRRLLKDESADPNDRVWFGHLCSSKQSLTVNLRDERGKALVRSLAAEADIVFENFSPGTIDRMGFGYDALKEINPDIIMASGSIFGQSGPLSRLPGTDATGAARGGRMGASGYVDGDPLLPLVTFGDSVLPYFIVATLVAALRHRDATGRGCRIDASMVELIAQQMAPAIVDPIAFPSRMGNRWPAAAPHNVFPVAGDDRWIALEIWSDEEWRRLCDTLGVPELALDPQFVTLDARKSNEDALEQAIADVTRGKDGDALMEQLQAGGLAAGMVQRPSDLVDHDPQLGHRGFLTPLAHVTRGEFPHQRTPITLSRTPAAMAPAPKLGGNTQEVLERVLGLGAADYARLAAEDVFT